VHFNISNELTVNVSSGSMLSIDAFHYHHQWGMDGSKMKEFCSKLMDRAPAPESIAELIICNCSKGKCRGRCSCRYVGLLCTDACKYVDCSNAFQAEEDDI
jgi:hypothetical protein